MAVFDQKNKFTPRDVKYVSTYEIPALDLRSANRLVDYQIKQQEKSLKDIEDNFNSIQDTQDALLGLRYDNTAQFEAYNKGKEKYNLTPETFAALDVNALKSPFTSRSIGGRLKQFMSDPSIVNAQKQVFYGDKFRDAIPTIKDPILRARAMGKYDEYKAGKIDPSSLSAVDYETVDLDKTILDAIKLVDEVETSEFHKSQDGNFMGVKTTKQRDKALVDQLIGDLVKKDPRIAENMKARGYMSEDGTVTDEYIKHRDAIEKSWTTPNSSINQVKEIDKDEVTGGSQYDKYGYGQGRFSSKSETERKGNILDQDLQNLGLEQLDMGTVLNAAKNGGRVVYLDGSDGKNAKGYYLISYDKDGYPIQRIPLKQAPARYYDSIRNAMQVNLSNDVEDNINKLIGGSEQDERGYKSYNPSTVTAAVGKYQFILSDYKDLIKSALRNNNINYKDISSIDYSVNNENGNMNEDDRKLAQAFLNSPEAQEEVFSKQRDVLKKDAILLSQDDDLKNVNYEGDTGLSLFDLMYIRHHEGSLEASKEFLLTGKSRHDSSRQNSTKEINNALKKIRATLRRDGYDGVTLSPEGEYIMNKISTSNTPSNTLSNTPSNTPSPKEDKSVFGEGFGN